MSKPKLIIGTVNSQPLGMKYEQFEELYQYSYKPFLKLLNTHGDVHAVLYYSGILLERLEEHHPEYIMLLHDLVRRKQVELVGGAYYEPFLPLIPNTDKLGQIEFLTTYLRRRFGTRVRGCWVPYGVWDHILPFTLKNSGMDYAFLNAADPEDGKTKFIPSITEEYGKSLIIYPVFSHLVEGITDAAPEESLKDLLKLLPNVEGGVVSLLFTGDRLFNGEKTLREREEWLQDFFKTVKENRDKIEYILPGTYSKNEKQVHKRYYAPTRYGELMEWRGKPYQDDDSVFKKSLIDFPESNVIYAKMMYVYQLVNQIRGDRSRKKTAREELWKGQGNSVFWHARDGGVYRSAYRKAAFSALLEAEKLTRERGIFKSSIVSTDIDLDGWDEYLYQGNTMNAYVTRAGGQMFEMDYLPSSWNYLDTMSLRDDKGRYVPYLRRTFIDHFLPTGKTLDKFEAGDYTEMNPCIEADYTVEEVERERSRLAFSFTGRVLKSNTEYTLNKKYQFKRNSVGVTYQLETGDGMKEPPLFASEINLSLPEPPGDRVRMFAVLKGERKPIVDERATLRQVSELIIEDSINRVCITLTGTKRFRLWMYQIYTRYVTESGEGCDYQSTCIIPAWHQAFAASKSWDVTLTLKVDKLTTTK